MSIFLLSGCCCGGPPCVTHKDEWESYYNLLRYQLADTPGGSTPISVDGWVPGVSVSLDGEGSFTVDIAAPTAALEVGSLITSLGVGASAGVTVRRADSADSISLWWLGGTSWELRQGSTVLESIVHAAGAFKLVLKTPLDPTTDVEVWIGASLVHTESAVAFVAPSELWHVGLITEGEATFSYLETTPCPKIIDCEPPGGCLPTVGTVEPPIVPVVWSFSVPAINNLSGDTECDLWGDDDFVLVNKWASVGYDYFDSNQWRTPIQTIDNVDPLPGDAEVYPLMCEWIAVIPSFDHRVFECSGEIPPAVPPGKLPVKWITCAFGNAAGNHPTSAGTLGPAWMLTLQYRNLGTLLAPDMEYRVWLSKQDVTGSTADYLGAWVKYNAADIISGAFVLSLVQNSGCDDLPATITVTAGGEDAIARRVLECWDTACTPPVTPQPGFEYILDLIFDDGTDIYERRVCMGVSFDEATGSWEWSGFIDPWGHPTCGTIPLSDYKIHCVEPEEGALKQWVLSIENTNGVERIPLSEDPMLGLVFDGTVDNMCPPSTWSVLGYNWTTATEGHQFGWCDMPLCDGNWFSAAITVNCSSGTVNGSALLLPTSGFPPGINPLTVMGTAYVGSVFGRTIWLWSDGAGYVFRFYDGITDTGINPIGGSFSCDIGGGATLDPGSASWSWTNSADPLGVCSGITGSASMSVTWT